jgi:hypothetical protein
VTQQRARRPVAPHVARHIHRASPRPHALAGGEGGIGAGGEEHCDDPVLLLERRARDRSDSGDVHLIHVGVGFE